MKHKKLIVRMTEKEMKHAQVLAAERGVDVSSYVRDIILFDKYQDYLNRKGLKK